MNESEQNKPAAPIVDTANIVRVLPPFPNSITALLPWLAL